MKKIINNILILTISAILIMFVFGCNTASQKNDPNRTYSEETRDLPQNIQNKNNTDIQQPAAPNSISDQDDNGQSLFDDEKPDSIEEYSSPTEPIFIQPQNKERKLWNEEAKWTMTVSKGDLLDALSKMGIKVASISPIIIDSTDKQGCCSVLSIGGRLINAYELCEKLKMPSSYITSIEIGKSNIVFEGRGSFEPLQERTFLPK